MKSREYKLCEFLQYNFLLWFLDFHKITIRHKGCVIISDNIPKKIVNILTEYGYGDLLKFTRKNLNYEDIPSF